MNKLARHYYDIGVQLALRSAGREKNANYKLISRLAPMGPSNIAAGLGHVTAGSLLGLGVGSAVAPEISHYLAAAGSLGGKLLKDRNTLNIAKNLSQLERRAVAKELGKGLAERAGATGLSLLGAAGLPLYAIPEVITNHLVRKRVGL